MSIACRTLDDSVQILRRSCIYSKTLLQAEKFFVINIDSWSTPVVLLWCPCSAYDLVLISSFLSTLSSKGTDLHFWRQGLVRATHRISREWLLQRRIEHMEESQLSINPYIAVSSFGSPDKKPCSVTWSETVTFSTGQSALPLVESMRACTSLFLQIDTLGLPAGECQGTNRCSSWACHWWPWQVTRARQEYHEHFSGYGKA